MADDVKVDSGSPERVAYDLWMKIQAKSPEEQTKLLTVYAKCLNAARGRG